MGSQSPATTAAVPTLLPMKICCPGANVPLPWLRFDRADGTVVLVLRRKMGTYSSVDDADIVRELDLSAGAVTTCAWTE